MSKPDYDTTIARIAGNIAAGLVGTTRYADMGDDRDLACAEDAVLLARLIVARVREGPEASCHACGAPLAAVEPVAVYHAACDPARLDRGPYE